jgi:hypothetical protein
LEFDLGFGRGGGRRRDDGGPMRLLLAGDFSGKARRAPPLASRPMLRVDIDNVDDVVRRMARAWPPASEVGFAQIDDFHYDRWRAARPVPRCVRRARNRRRPAMICTRLLGKPAEPDAPRPRAAQRRSRHRRHRNDGADRHLRRSMRRLPSRCARCSTRRSSRWRRPGAACDG